LCFLIVQSRKSKFKCFKLTIYWKSAHKNFFSALTTFRKETDEGQEIELHPFEVAALMNLMAADSKPDEPLTLIPSLKRFSEAALDEILQMISDTMKRIND
jgi:DNA-directed RNA polymerase II subunit RPB4